MCLTLVFNNEKMERELAPEPEVMTVYKIVERNLPNPGFKSYDIGNVMRGGLQKADTTIRLQVMDSKQSYYSGFHCYVSRNDRCQVVEHSNKNARVISCLVKKEWITAIGMEFDDMVIVASQAIFPNYPETEARYEDLPAVSGRPVSAWPSGPNEGKVSLPVLPALV